jgi:hypothetical protein
VADGVELAARRGRGAHEPSRRPAQPRLHALSALLVKDTSGDTGLAPLLGSIGVLPCIAGVVAVAMLWRPSS